MNSLTLSNIFDNVKVPALGVAIGGVTAATLGLPLIPSCAVSVTAISASRAFAHLTDCLGQQYGWTFDQLFCVSALGQTAMWGGVGMAAHSMEIGPMGAMVLGTAAAWDTVMFTYSFLSKRINDLNVEQMQQAQILQHLDSAQDLMAKLQTLHQRRLDILQQPVNNAKGPK